MRKILLVISTLIFVSTNALAFCSLTDDACQQSERMLRLQEQQMRQQQTYQEEQLRLQRQEMVNNSINQSHSGDFGYRSRPNW